MGNEEKRRPLRVLIVEDSEMDAELLLLQLASGGYEVAFERVQTAPALKQALAAKRWDIVISDYSMPQFDAPKALEVLKASGHDIPFIVVSGTIGEETAVDALKSGAHDFLSKGKIARLLPAIERELREAGVREARRHAERALRESEQRYRRILETTSEGVWELDAAASISYLNARMATLLGITAEQVLGRSPFDFVHDESRERFTACLARRELRTAGHVEIRLRRRDNLELWVLLDSTPIFDAAGGYAGALVMAVDITERKRLEDQLLQSQKMEAVGRLAGGVAHDFNNLLTVIASYTALSIEMLDASDPVRFNLDEVIKASERAADMTHQLLAFSRRQVLQPRTVDLNLIVAGVQKMLRRLLREHIDLALLPALGLGTVRADPGQLEQVIINLVVNAQDAMPQGGQITIETANLDLAETYAGEHLGVEPGQYVLLSLKDNGSGMDSDTRARIFEPFFTTKETGKGTGLGLATVLGIVQQSGGRILVDSEIGRGTTFRIYLPRTDAPLDSLASSLPPLPTLDGTETILLVEDEAAVRAATRAVLLRHGYTVLEAENGMDALFVSERHASSIELMITDVIMPGMSGRELAERMTSVRRGTKVLYVSGYTEDSTIHDGVNASKVEFLQKPIRPDLLVRKVRMMLDSSAAHAPKHK